MQEGPKAMRHNDSNGQIWSAESCIVLFINGRTQNHKRKKIKNSVSLVYGGGNFLHSRLIILNIDAGLLYLVDQYQ